MLVDSSGNSSFINDRSSYLSNDNSHLPQKKYTSGTSFREKMPGLPPLTKSSHAIKHKHNVNQTQDYISNKFGDD